MHKSYQHKPRKSRDKNPTVHTYYTCMSKQTISLTFSGIQQPVYNYCASNPCVHGHCGSTYTGFYCSCQHNYKGVICDGCKLHRLFFIFLGILCNCIYINIYIYIYIGLKYIYIYIYTCTFKE